MLKLRWMALCGKLSKPRSVEIALIEIERGLIELREDVEEEKPTLA